MPGSGGCVGVDSARVSMGCGAVAYHVPPIVRQDISLRDNCKTDAIGGL